MYYHHKKTFRTLYELIVSPSIIPSPNYLHLVDISAYGIGFHLQAHDHEPFVRTIFVGEKNGWNITLYVSCCSFSFLLLLHWVK